MSTALFTQLLISTNNLAPLKFITINSTISINAYKLLSHCFWHETFKQIFLTGLFRCAKEIMKYVKTLLERRDLVATLKQVDGNC